MDTSLGLGGLVSGTCLPERILLGCGATEDIFLQPKRRFEKTVIVWEHDLFEISFCATSFSLLAFDAKTLLIVHRAEEVVPNLKEKATVVWFKDHSLRMVAVVLERRIDDRVVRIRVVQFVAPVKVTAIGIEEHTELEEKQVDVEGDEHRKKKKRHRPHELVDELVGDDGEGARVVEYVMSLVVLPEHLVFVTQIMIIKLQKSEAIMTPAKAKTWRVTP